MYVVWLVNVQVKPQARQSPQPYMPAGFRAERASAASTKCIISGPKINEETPIHRQHTMATRRITSQEKTHLDQDEVKVGNKPSDTSPAVPG